MLLVPGLIWSLLLSLTCYNGTSNTNDNNNTNNAPAGISKAGIIERIGRALDKAPRW